MNQYEAIEKFDIQGSLVEVSPYGTGHINTTFCAVFDESTTKHNQTEKPETKRYILQKVNTHVFQHTHELMHNIELVTEFCSKIVKQNNGDPDRECLNLINTKAGKKYLSENGEFWRVYQFVENSKAFEKAESAEHLLSSGKAFGKFISNLEQFDSSQLFEVIKDFHNTKQRYQNFLSCLDKNFENRKSTCSAEIDFVLARKNLCRAIVDRLDCGDIPMRVTHNDTKLNNVLFDADTEQAICVIDLDTIMQGSLLYDFGDSIRSSCNTALEDEKNLDIVHFDKGLYDAFTQGFLSGIGNSITEQETALLPLGAIIMTYECGMRFLSDYLDGDNYFKTKYDTHNLVRARTQFKLVHEMEQTFNMHF